VLIPGDTFASAMRADG